MVPSMTIDRHLCGCYRQPEAICDRIGFNDGLMEGFALGCSLFIALTEGRVGGVASA
jgi:hypothetical protein